MKQLVYFILGIAILAWPIEVRNLMIPVVYATSPTGTSSVTLVGTNTATTTNTFTSNPNTNTAHNDNQNTTQQDTEDLNDQGSQQSTMLGMLAIAAGAAMVAAGMAMLPPNMGLIMAGMALIAAGMMALMAAGMMGNNADKAGYRSGTMSGLTGTTASGTSTTPGHSGGIKIDPNLLRNGQADSIFTDLENKTGINRDDFVNSIGNGANPASMLANAPKLKGLGVSEDSLKGLLADAQNSNLPSADDIMGKLGLTPEELAAMAKKNTAFGDDNALTAGGRNPASKSASNSTPDINSFLNGNKEDLNSSVDKLNNLNLSPEVKAALDRNGITGQSIFEMVHVQYKKKTPMMFGVQKKKTISTSENPFLNLNGNDVNL